MYAVDRAKGILLKPGAEWDDIADEAVGIPELYRKWIAIVAAIPALATFIRISVLGAGVFGTRYNVPLATGLLHAVVSYLASLASVYVMAMVIDALAPRFGAHRNFGQAFKVAAFAPAAAWLAGAFDVLPVVSLLTVLGLYSLYLLYVGLPRVMNSAPERSLAYAATVCVVALVIHVLAIVATGFLLPGSGGVR